MVVGKHLVHGEQDSAHLAEAADHELATLCEFMADVASADRKLRASNRHLLWLYGSLLGMGLAFLGLFAYNAFAERIYSLLALLLEKAR